jgi:DNA-binding Xre family transcriptional regulator
MLIVNLKALIERKSAIEKRRITYKVIEQETGVKALTLSRIATNHNYNFSRKDLEKLLLFFNCQPNDLLSLIREEKWPHPGLNMEGMWFMLLTYRGNVPVWALAWSSGLQDLYARSDVCEKTWEHIK